MQRACTQRECICTACRLSSNKQHVDCAGVPLIDLPVACTAGLLQGQHVLDLNHFEELSKCPFLFLAHQPSTDTIIVLQTFSRQAASAFESLLESAMTACAKVHGEMHAALSERLQQQAIAAGHVEA